MNKEEFFEKVLYASLDTLLNPLVKTIVYSKYTYDGSILCATVYSHKETTIKILFDQTYFVRTVDPEQYLKARFEDAFIKLIKEETNETT